VSEGRQERTSPSRPVRQTCHVAGDMLLGRSGQLQVVRLLKGQLQVVRLLEGQPQMVR